LRIILIEDEHGAAQNLRAILAELQPAATVLAELDSVEESVAWIKANPAPDLGFFDIQLADGSSFDIFKQVAVDFPVIFTTAFDQYAIQAFKVNSIDYLLKPINKEALQSALKKYEKQYLQPVQLKQMLALLQRAEPPTFRQSFLVSFRDQLIPVPIQDCAYFSVENAQLFLYTSAGKRWALDHTLDQLEEQLNPQFFFRANRQFLVAKASITAIQVYFNGRLLLTLNPPIQEKVIISKARRPLFKQWIDQ